MLISNYNIDRRSAAIRYASSSRFRATRAWSLTGLGWLKEKSYEYSSSSSDFIARSFSEFAKQEATASIALTGQTVLITHQWFSPST
ncbi:hypothetical protein O9992_28625 [Vibrio lentus]|nr:hypothetical protein [Vibrio lentus]